MISSGRPGGRFRGAWTSADRYDYMTPPRISETSGGVPRRPWHRSDHSLARPGAASARIQEVISSGRPGGRFHGAWTSAARYDYMTPPRISETSGGVPRRPWHRSDHSLARPGAASARIQEVISSGRPGGRFRGAWTSAAMNHYMRSPRISETSARVRRRPWYRITHSHGPGLLEDPRSDLY